MLNQNTLASPDLLSGSKLMENKFENSIQRRNQNIQEDKEEEYEDDFGRDSAGAPVNSNLLLNQESTILHGGQLKNLQVDRNIAERRRRTTEVK